MVEDIRATLAASAQRAQQMAQMMALRDGFAAQAMQGVLAALPPEDEADVPKVAEFAYRMADAMLRQRGQAVAAKGQPS